MNETIKATLTADGTQFNREFQRTEQTVTGFQGKMMVAAKAIAGFFAARALLRGVNTLRQEIDDLGKTATRLRLPTAQVQIFEVAAKRGGTNIDTLVTSLNRAQVAATEAGRGTETYAREFAALSINVAEFQRLDPQQRLNVLADAYKNATDQGEAFTALTRIMGRSVSQLIPLLQGGSEALDELASKVNVIDEAEIRRIEEMNDKITILSANLRTTLMQTVVEMAPQIEKLTQIAAQSLEDVGKLVELIGGLGGVGQGQSTGDAIELLDLIEKHNKNLFWYGTRRRDIAKERLKMMPEEVRLEAELAMEVRRITEMMASGEMSREAGLARFKMLRGQVDETIKLRQEEEARAAAIPEITASLGDQVESIEAQARAMEQLARAEEKARGIMKDRLFDLQSQEEQLAAIRAEARAIFAENGGRQSPGEMRNRIDQIDDPEERLKAIQDLNRLLELRDQALDIQQKIQRTAQDTADAEAAAADDALRAKERELAAAQELARIQATQDRAKENFAAETEALKLELAGRKDLADALREEVRMRADAVSLAERMGSTEEEALALLRQQAQLRRQLEGRDAAADGERGGPRGSRIRQAGRIGRLGEGRRLGGGPTLREASLDRLAATRTANTPPTDAARQEAAKYWEQQIDLQAQLLKKFTQLTTV